MSTLKIVKIYKLKLTNNLKQKVHLQVKKINLFKNNKTLTNII